MIYKSLFLAMIFVLVTGVSKTNAQCECIDAITDAVDAVMLTSGCDEDVSWEAPHALEVHLKKLQNWCGERKKPLKSKIPNIVEGMLGTIQDAYEGEIWVDPLTGLEVVIQEPAPECAIEALSALENLLNECSGDE